MSHSPIRFHNPHSQYASFIDLYIKRELSLGALYEPFDENPLCVPLTVSPLFTVPKDDTDRGVIIDCSFGNTESVNDGIPQHFFLGEPLRLCYPRHDEFVSLIVKFCQKCHIWKCDLSRAFTQLHVDPHDLHLLGCKWNGNNYIDNRLIFGMRSSPQACQRTTNAISYMLYSANISIVNYVDYFGGVSKSESSYFDYQYMLDLLNNLGLDVNFVKCVKPSTEMVFWGKLYNTESMTCVSQRRRSKKLLTCYIGFNIENVVQSVNFGT